MKGNRSFWAWRKFGGSWMLVEDVGERRVVLDVGMDNTQGDWDPPGVPVMVTRGPDGVLVPITPDMPVARLIVEAPEMYSLIKKLITTVVAVYGIDAKTPYQAIIDRVEGVTPPKE